MRLHTNSYTFIITQLMSLQEAHLSLCAANPVCVVSES